MDIRNYDSIQVFKSKIYQPVVGPIKYHELYNFGSRFLAIQHTSLRLGSSQLNFYLFKIGAKDTDKCSCGLATEDT